MTVFVALLRAINVGGTGKLAMSDLRALCEKIGFAEAQTYIASGNVVFDSPLAAPVVRKALEGALNSLTGQNVTVFLRTAAELAEVLRQNPFPEARGDFAYALFLEAPPPPEALEAAKGRTDEALRLGAREIYLHYPRGMGASQLNLPLAKAGTARNMKTIARLVEICQSRLSA